MLTCINTYLYTFLKLSQNTFTKIIYQTMQENKKALKPRKTLSSKTFVEER